MIQSFTWFRKVAFWEGVSYVVLLLIAMPMKYIFKIDWAVKSVGAAHGALFVAYVILMLMTMIYCKRSIKWGVVAFLISLVPFGTFLMEKKWKQEEVDFKKSIS